MVQLFNKIKQNKWVFRSLLKTIYFNFHFLPCKQAIHLPIWLYKPKFGKLCGSIEIQSSAKFGMIRLGYKDVGLYRNSGIFLDVCGRVIFKNTALIGNDSYLCIGPKGKLSIGDNFRATTTFRLACYKEIKFADNVRIGWDCLVIDSDFHKMRRMDGSFTKGYASVCIGENNWITNNCKILKGTTTPAFCTVSAGTVLSGPVEVPEYSIIGQDKRIVVSSSGKWLDPADCDIEELSE